jgi:hypothetical protein
MSYKSRHDVSPGTPRWDKWLERRGLLKYQTSGLSDAEVTARYNRFGLEPDWVSLVRRPGEGLTPAQPSPEAWGPNANIPAPGVAAPTLVTPNLPTGVTNPFTPPYQAAAPTIVTPNLPAVVTPSSGPRAMPLPVQGSGHGIGIPGLTVVPDPVSESLQAGRPWWDQAGVMHRGAWRVYGLSLQDQQGNVYNRVERIPDGYMGFDRFGHQVHIDLTGKVRVKVWPWESGWAW